MLIVTSRIVRIVHVETVQNLHIYGLIIQGDYFVSRRGEKGATEMLGRIQIDQRKTVILVRKTRRERTPKLPLLENFI